MRARALLLAAGLACAAVGGVTGCAAQRQHDALSSLQESVEAYNEAYRWKNFERAATFVPADLRAAFLAAYEDEDNSLHIEDYQIIKADLDSDTAATVTVRVRFMLLPSVTVERKTVVQHWHRVNGAWVLETEDNAIRPIDPTKAPKNRESFGGELPEGSVDGKAKLEVRGPNDRDDDEPAPHDD